MEFIDKPQLRPQFKYWSLHVGGTALPSFLLALKQFNSPGAIAGMLAGVAAFICGYSLLSSTVRYRQLGGTTLLGRSVKIGTKIRLWLSLATAPLLLTGLYELPVCMLAPDFWAGFGAFILVSAVFEAFGGGPGGGSLLEAGPGFLMTFSITIIEGLIISFTLVAIVFFTLIFQSRKANRLGGKMN